MGFVEVGGFFVVDRGSGVVVRSIIGGVGGVNSFFGECIGGRDFDIIMLGGFGGGEFIFGVDFLDRFIFVFVVGVFRDGVVVEEEEIERNVVLVELLVVEYDNVVELGY